MDLKVLGTDEFKSRFVVFYIDRGETMNAYVWVDEGGRVRITDIYGLASYCNHAVSPIYVGNDIPEDMVNRAIETLKNMPADQMKEMLEGFNERDKELQEAEERYKEREEYEDACIKDIEEGNGIEDGKFWFM